MTDARRSGFGTRIRVAGIGGCMAVAVALSACSAKHHAVTGTGAVSSAATSASSSPTPPLVAVSSSPNPGPTASKPVPSASPTHTKPPTTKNGYSAAKTQWKKGATAISAEQGLYWAAAAADLKAGQPTDPGDTSFYPTAIKDLKELIALPDAQQTPVQNAQYHSDIKTLNGFFQTPGLYQ